MNDNVKVYEPSNSNKNLFSILRDMFTDLFSSKDLAYRLFIRDKKAEYSQSIFGVLWAFFTPLATTVTWIFLSASGAVKIQATHVPYPVYVFLGTMLWSVFVESVMTPLTQTQNAKDILSKVNFPKEAILLSGLFKNGFNITIKLILIAGMLIIYQVKIDSGIFLLPLLLLLLVFLGYSIGLLVTPIGMLYKDVSRALPLVFSFLMYLSPVVYKGGISGKMAKLIEINPLTPLINSARNVLTAYPVENPVYLACIFGVSLVLFFIGWMFYRVSVPIIIERM
ncbi:lipopolysaccharide transport system permease protein [Chryseobacterium defluvii]|uniref:Transport permease protein n=1 Tax=Chryseobacterium defluvii TaxID=160396 RepID=A0A840KB09_9FLAO|nr:ABC transporter permease [Chryseobacterium defluvii]MBB4806599.1 lipopolysaccharide transport system permease protein [Chryseobacterium defluvii]